MSEVKLLKSFGSFASDIKLTHSIFALPFVGTALVMANVSEIGATKILLVIVCMVSARSFAMGMNRYLDSDIDRDNVRTSNRAIPSGRLSKKGGLYWSLSFACIFIAFAFLLSDLAGKLAIPLLMVLSAYSFMKRFTWLTHWYLGMCLGLAPIAAEIAIRGFVSTEVLCIGSAVALWTAGFDLLYSLQDRQYDVEKGLHSVPSKFGPRVTLALSIFSFVGMITLLFVAGQVAGMGHWYRMGLWFVAGVLAFEHWLVRDAWAQGTSSRISAAFFNANAIISVVLFVFVIVDKYLK